MKEKIVPLCLELRKEQEKRLGVDRLHYYDEELIFPEGNAVPEGTTEELVAKAQKMYHELSKETGEFFDLWWSMSCLTWRRSRENRQAVTAHF